MATKTVYLKLPQAMPHQASILLDPSRFKVVVCGRRWGKSAMGLLMVLKGHGPAAGHFKGALQGGQIWWVAPTFAIAREIWRDLKRACRQAWTEKNEVERRIDLPGGGSVTVRSADDPQSLVAAGLDGVVVDEAGKVKQDAWRESLRPALTDKQGWAAFIGTPKGMNWFKELFDRAGSDDATNWRSWQRPTADNPLVTASELAQAKYDMLPHAFAQEHEAKFVSLEGAHFPEEWFGESIWADQWPKEFQFCSIAVDPSLGKDAKRSDYSAIVYVGTHGGLWWIDASLQRRPATKIVSDALDFSLKYPAHDGLIVETNQFQQLLMPEFTRQIAERKIPGPPLIDMPNYGVGKQTRILRVGPHLMRGHVRFRRTAGAKLLVDQLREFPMGDHDDGPDGMEMAMRHLNSVAGAMLSEDEDHSRVMA